MAKIVLVHGIRAKRGGAATIDQCAMPLRELGHDVDTDSADYGNIFLTGVRRGLRLRGKDKDGRKMRPLGERLFDAFMWADVIATHSNGGNFTMQALNKYSSQFAFQKYLQGEKKVTGNKRVIHFSPAMSRNVKIPLCVDHMWVYHTKNDRVVGWLARVAGLLPGNKFGTAGAYGYRGEDSRVTNVSMAGITDDHSEWFGEDLSITVNAIHKHATEVV